jgi:hypothetical protein
VDARFVMKLEGLNILFLEGVLIWEQEVGGSNPLAPTNDFK